MARPLTEGQYFDNGAGKGPGLAGNGSQTAGEQATVSDSGSGSTTSGTGATKSSNAAMRGTVPALDKAPMMISGLVVLFTLVGALAL